MNNSSFIIYVYTKIKGNWYVKTKKCFISKVMGTYIIYRVRGVFYIDIYVLGICCRWFYVLIADLKYGVRFLHNPI
jgi:hypothetical protein